MSFSNIENRYLNLFKEINSDFVVRFTPQFKMMESVIDGRILKMSNTLKSKGYDYKGYIVKDFGKFSGIHFHSNIRLLEGDKGKFKDDFLSLLDRFGFNGFIENFDNIGGYEEYMVSKLKFNNYWVGLWGI